MQVVVVVIAVKIFFTIQRYLKKYPAVNPLN